MYIRTQNKTKKTRIFHYHRFVYASTRLHY